MQAISDEALAFQREKQARLNQVEVVLLLRLHQIQLLQEDGQVPSDLSGALLFSSAELDKLKRRVHVGHSLSCFWAQRRPLVIADGVNFLVVSIVFSSQSTCCLCCIGHGPVCCCHCACQLSCCLSLLLCSICAFG